MQPHSMSTIESALTQPFKVLDHGYVQLIDFMGDDKTVVEAARMSTGKGFISWDQYRRCKECGLVEQGDILYLGNLDSDVQCTHPSWERYPNGDMGLLDNLWRNRHATPFEMCEVVFEIFAPIFVFREWHRHRTQSINEFSGRYSKMPNLHYVPSIERLKALKSANKQASSLDRHLGEEVDAADLEAMCSMIHNEQQEVYEQYETLLKKGVPKEVARVNTPVARYSKMRVKTDLRNWLAFQNLRIRPSAQWEIRQYAERLATFFAKLFPRTWGLFEEYDLYGVRLSRTEIRILRSLLVVGTSASLREACEEAGLVGSKKDEFLTKLSKGGEEILG